MELLIPRFLKFLDREYDYLIKVSGFLADVPTTIAKKKDCEIDYQNFIEKHEIKSSILFEEKKALIKELADKLSLDPQKVTLKLLANMGYSEFAVISQKLNAISSQISYQLLRISIYLNNYSRLNQNFSRFNQFLYQRDYSPQQLKQSVNSGSTFIQEA